MPVATTNLLILSPGLAAPLKNLEVGFIVGAGVGSAVGVGDAVGSGVGLGVGDGVCAGVADGVAAGGNVVAGTVALGREHPASSITSESSNAIFFLIFGHPFPIRKNQWNYTNFGLNKSMKALAEYTLNCLRLNSRVEVSKIRSYIL